MLAPTPPIGWNSWNTFGDKISDELICQTADAIIRQGLRDAGYQYVVIDDLWQLRERDADGRLIPDPEKFPKGIRPLADYVHQLGLKFGIYSCAGVLTCGGRAGSYGYEDIDAATFASWGVDYLKYDYCYKAPGGPTGPQLYFRMGQALRASGRPIVYSACEWGSNEPWNWAATAGCQLWRTTHDIEDSWDAMEKIGFGQNGKERFAGPKRWNDPDMLVVGMYGKGHVGRGGMTDNEYRLHFALWCMLAAPLMLGCDVREMTPFTKTLLTHRGLIDINQDSLGAQGYRIATDWDAFETWTKPMADGSIIVGLFNRSNDRTRSINAGWESLHLHDRTPCKIVDVFTAEDLGIRTRHLGYQVPAHDCKILRLYPQ